MADRRCFVQFPHPGAEHGPNTGRQWHRSKISHKRKFMQLGGKWIEKDGSERTGDLWAWGEWEPESDLVRKLNPLRDDDQYPRYLWEPYYVPKKCYRGWHNTDPFIFGRHFFYSNCGQPADSKRSLKHLDRGSVIAFGSGKAIKGKRRWTLDTVLVVRDSFRYDPLDPRGALEGKVSETFLSVTGGPLSADSRLARRPEPGGLRLYRGATPSNRVNRMFSFFPAIPAGTHSGFPRPVIDLPGEYFTPSNWQAPKGAKCNRNPEELRCLWLSLVKQVRNAGLKLGTNAKLPPRRRAT